MQNEQKAREFLEKFCACRPKDFFKKLDDKTRGLYIILNMLYFASADISAGDISASLGMSTPRVAAALNVLESKGHISREQSAKDARRVIVRITDTGRREYEARERGLVELADYIIGEVGESELNEFLRISAHVQQALQKRLEAK